MTIEYHIYTKDYLRGTKTLLGVFRERRNILRGKTPSEAGLTWAKKFFRQHVKDPQAIFVKVK